MNDHLFQNAFANLQKLEANPYPGRIIIAGPNDSGTYFIQVYAIMGRSESSRNRLFVETDKGSVKTEAIDPTKIKNPELVIYPAMLHSENCYSVSNGNQTPDALAVGLTPWGLTSPRFLTKWSYEPDAPNYTPRITANFLLGDNTTPSGLFLEMSMLKKSACGDIANIYNFRYRSFVPGIGYCMSTYDGDGDPLPSFTGEPYVLPLIGSPEQIAESIWSMLNLGNRVALVVKSIDLATGKASVKIINEYATVGA